MGLDPSESFRQLRPICIKLSKEPSPQNIKDLECKLRNVDATHLSQLVEYVLFPLKLALQSTNATNELQETAVGCMETLFKRTCVSQLGTFEDIFSYLCMLLNSKDSGLGQVADIPEELKLAIVNCLSCLVQHTSLVVKGAFFSPRYLPVLGHSVSILLALADKEKLAKNLKLSALGCLVNLAFCSETKSGEHLKQDEDREALENAIKDSLSLTFASFIPGISIALCRVITGDTKQGHAVVMQAVELWGDILSLVMNDKYMPVKPAENEDVISQLFSFTTEVNSVGELANEKANISNSNPEKQDKIQSLKVNRTADWFRDTASKLKIVMERMKIISMHPNWKVRLSLIKFCDKLFTNCLGSLQTCVSTMVDLLVGLIEDDYLQVASVSKTTLQKLSKRIGNGPSTLNALLEENLHSTLTALPRLMRTADDAKKIQSLNHVLGYMNLLGNRLSSLLNSSSHLKRLSLALVQVLEFDVGDVGVVEERTPSFSETAVAPSETKGGNPMSYPADQFSGSKYPTYRFKHFTDEKVMVAVNQVCHVLGCYGNLPLICDYFLDLFHESKLYQKQAVYILTEIVFGSSRNTVIKLETSTCNGNEDAMIEADIEGRSPLEVQDIVEILITEYISDVNWNLVTSNPPLLHKPTSSDPQDFLSGKKDIKPIKTLPFEVLNSNIQLNCLMLEAIGVFSKVCGSQFEHYLMKVLYPVMAKLGSDNAAVSRSAYETLIKICQSCGYVSVDELIAKNADYLVNSISLDFKYVFMNSQAPCVLRVMIQYSNPGILSIIEDTLMDVFSVIDLYPDELLYLLMKVLNVLVQMIGKWFPATDLKAPAENIHKNKTSFNHVENQTQQGEEETVFSADDIRQFFEDYHKRKQHSMGYLDGDNDESVTTEPDREGAVEDSFAPDKKPEIPTHVKYITQVLEKCVHFLSSKSPWLRLLVLDTVEAGVLALRQSEDHLLPMIHRVWPPMVKRFTDDEQVVTIKAVNVLSSMAEVSGTFMQRRVVKDAIPPMIQFLDKQATVSLKAGPVYSQSQAFKLQLAVLRSLGRLCKQLEVVDASLSPVVWTCSQYLSCRQPKELQQMAITTFNNFASVEPDLIWLSLNDLYCPEELTPPHEALKPVKLAGTGAQSKEYAENVTALLSAI